MSGLNNPSGDKHKFIVHVDHMIRTAGRLSLWIAFLLPGGDTLPILKLPMKITQNNTNRGHNVRKHYRCFYAKIE